MDRKRLVLSALAGLVTGLLAGFVTVTLAWVAIGWQAIQGLATSYSSTQAIASMGTGLSCGGPPGALFGVVGGVIGGLIGQRAKAGRWAIPLAAAFGFVFGLGGGICGYLASGFLAK